MQRLGVKASNINAISGKIPGLRAIGVRKYEFRVQPGAYRPNHIVAGQEMANEGVAVQAYHELRGIR